MDFDTFVAANSWLKQYPDHFNVARTLFRIAPADMIFFDGADDIPMKFIDKKGLRWTNFIHRVRGALGGCHSNSVYAHTVDPRRLKIVTGFGFSDDGHVPIWVRHTWIHDRATNNIVETTMTFKHYYGAEIKNESMLARFIELHHPVGVAPDPPADIP